MHLSAAAGHPARPRRFALFCFLVAVTLEPLGAPAAFELAAAGALIVAFVLTVLSRGPGRVDE